MQRHSFGNLATGQRRGSSRRGSLGRRRLRRGSLGTTTKQSAVRRARTTSTNFPDQPSEFLADSDGSLLDRPTSDIVIDNNCSDNRPKNEEVLPLPTYTANGQRCYDFMIEAVHF